MNNDRRKRLAQLTDLLGKLEDLRSQAYELAEEVASEEREYYDNMPESLQGSEKGERASTAADNLDEVKDALEEVDFNDLTSKVEEASE